MFDFVIFDDKFIFFVIYFRCEVVEIMVFLILEGSSFGIEIVYFVFVVYWFKYSIVFFSVLCR